MTLVTKSSGARRNGAAAGARVPDRAPGPDRGRHPANVGTVLELDAIPDRLLVADEVARRLDVKPSWVRAATRRAIDPIPCVELGRWKRYDWLAIVEWLDRQRG